MSEKWDCRCCGLTYDETIEEKPKNGICNMCKHTPQKKTEFKGIKKWL